MSEKRKKARARALRAAQVVSIAGALLGGCNESHVPGQDGSTDGMLVDANIPDAIDRDANIPDANIPDLNIPDDRVPDASVDAQVPDATCPVFDSCGGECTPMAEQCCTMAGGQYNLQTGECCPGCAIGPIPPPELMV